MIVDFGSVCSGIEAASVALDDLGYQAAWLAEIEPNPAHILAVRQPHAPNLGDMTKLPARVRAREIPAPRVLIGGTPCQAFSVAGVRAGMLDARGQLTLTYVDLLNAIDEQRPGDECVGWWENVPGVLSDKGNAFGCFLGLLAGEECELFPPGSSWPNAGVVHGPQRSIAWRVLDAQYFGVAQRRRRVFVVASARAGFDPAAVLFERDGVRRDSAPRRDAGENTAAGTLRSSDGGSDVDHAWGGHLQPVAAVQVCPTLRAGGNATGGNRPPGTDVDTADSLLICTSHANAGIPPAIAFVADDYKNGTFEQIDVARTLTTSADRTRAAPIISAYGFQPRIARNGRGDMGDVVSALTAQAGDTGKGDAAPHVAVAGMSVRRLTPRECERLQGFPDDYTLVPLPERRAAVRMEKLDRDYIKYLARGGRMTFDECMRAMADGPRYKALGNSMAVPVMRWIGRRILVELKLIDAHDNNKVSLPK